VVAQQGDFDWHVEVRSSQGVWSIGIVGGVRSACSKGNVRLSVLTAVLFVLGVTGSKQRSTV